MTCERCVVCGRRLVDQNHRCSRSVMSLYRKAERLAALAEDPEEPGIEAIAPKLLRKLRRYGLILEFTC
ncbi:MAG TPA: hypothetical protein PKG77_25680 [Phycisphaerae bacterium]|nr:hypothetical protein [Phycisphaerae bacterium]HQL76262.1 hypothetical protein [Phycisphaerae bacterium]